MIKTLAPVYIKREGTVKVKYAYKLGSERLIELREETTRLLDVLNEKKNLVTDALEAKFKELKTNEERKIFINIKRDVFNLRLAACKNIRKNRSILESRGLYDKLDEFVETFEKYSEMKKTWDTVYSEEELSERENLVNAYKDNKEILDKAVKFIHPTILCKIKPYLETSVYQHTSKLRKCDDTVAKLITRASHKTSPFSTLTNVGAGIMGESVSNPPIKINTNEKYFTVTKFNLAYAMRIFDSVMQLPELIRLSSFHFADTLVLLRGVFYWTILKDDPQKRKKVYKSVDELIKVKATEPLAALYESFRDRNSISFGEMINFLTDNCDMPDEVADTMLITLVRKQFFENTTFLDQNSDNIIGEFISIMSVYQAELNSEVIRRLIGHLEKINAVISRIDNESSSIQFCSLISVSKHIKAITEEYGIEPFDEKQLLYQDSLLQKIEEIDENEWKPVLDTLQIYQEFNGIFDVAYRFQLFLGKMFYEKFGNEKVYVKDQEHIILDTLLTNLIKHTNLWDDQLRTSSEDFGIPEIRKLEELKCKFLKRLFNESDKDVINISNDELMEYIHKLPELVKERTQSNSFFIQNTGRSDLKVLNNFYAGHQIFFARFLKNMPSICNNEKFRRYISETMDKDSISDIFLMFGFNANIRKPLTKIAISLPNNRYIHNDENCFSEVVDWKDMYLQYSHETKRIHLYKGCCELKAQFLGSLVTTLLPALPAMIHILNFNVVLLKDIGYSLIFDYMEKKQEFDVKCFPRIIVGDNVVVSRRRWLVKTYYLSELTDKNGSELIRCTLELAEKYNLPRRSFVSKFFYKNEGLDTADDNTDKPMYMDLSSPVLSVILKKIIQNTKYIIFEELLPDMNDSNDEYVSEYIFESTFTKGE